MELLRRHAEQGGEAVARLVHLGAAGPAGGVGGVGLDLARAVEPRQPVDRLAAGVGAAGVLEEGLAGQLRLGEGGELGPDEGEVEAGLGNGHQDFGRP